VVLLGHLLAGHGDEASLVGQRDMFEEQHPVEIGRDGCKEPRIVISLDVNGPGGNKEGAYPSIVILVEQSYELSGMKFNFIIH
jgi:hypothetical protein